MLLTSRVLLGSLLGLAGIEPVYAGDDSASATSTAGLVDYIFAGLGTTPYRDAAYTATPEPAQESVVTVGAEAYTVAMTYWEPEQTSVVAVLHGGLTALLADGHSLTLHGEQIAVTSTSVVVIGTEPSVTTVTAPAQVSATTTGTA